MNHLKKVNNELWEIVFHKAMEIDMYILILIQD